MSVQSLPEASPDHLYADLQSTLSALNQVILDKPDRLKLALAALLAGGHLLIEDLPGVGKTTLAHALAHCLGLSFKRIQFTSDLLPADITGISVYRQQREAFEFVAGPLFAELVLADEVNRATPKAQSALLEAMQEKQVTVDGVSRALPQPFFVVATQNPLEQSGTFGLPESQLDRFTLRISMGYPGAEAERALLSGDAGENRLNDIQPVLNAGKILALQSAVSQVIVSEPILDYLQAIVEHTRQSPDYRAGLSPRGAMALAQASRAYALLEGRQAVYPDDVQTLIPAVVGHRLQLRGGAIKSAEEIGHDVVTTVAIP